MWDAAPRSAERPSELKPGAGPLEGDAAAAAAWRAAGGVRRRLLPAQPGRGGALGAAARVARLDAAQLARRLQARDAGWPRTNAPASTPYAHPPSRQQALDAIEAAGPFLLLGVTGSGKTEVYLRAIARRWRARGAGAGAGARDQPHAAARGALRARFGAAGGRRAAQRPDARAAPAQLAGGAPRRGASCWARALRCSRSLPRLGLIVVDEEHDPATSSRRARATPRATWRCTAAARTSRSCWARPRRRWRAGSARAGATAARLPEPHGRRRAAAVRVVDMNAHQPRRDAVLAAAAGGDRASAWRAASSRWCSSTGAATRRCWPAPPAAGAATARTAAPDRVFHKIDRTLRCHHCGFTERVPRACPDCGNVDIAPLGRGTERLEEQLAELLATRGAGRRAGRASRAWTPTARA